MNEHPYELMVIEDNPGDVALLKEVFAEADLVCNFRPYGYGELALEALNADLAAHTLPDIIFLDLNLRGDDGFTMLRKLKSNPQTCAIPVIVMSSSSAPEDIQRAYKEHANAYISKPLNFEEFIQKIRTIKEFWFNTAKLPSGK